MVTRSRWTRQELIVAFALYCRLPFGRLHYRNPEIIQCAEAIGRTPSALAMKLVNIASLDPEITSTGRSGLKGASANDRVMWNEMNSDWQRFAVECEQALERILIEVEPVTEPVADPMPDYTDVPVGGDRLVQATVRAGQKFFRAAVLSAYNEQCCITGLGIPKLLEASHIVPWNHDRANRTNPRNGLLLSALHHKAFDAGLLTINADMTVRVSHQHIASASDFFSTAFAFYHGKPISLPEKFVPQQDFLAYHREHIFQG